MLQHKKTPKVMCNMLKLATICASHFAFLLLPTGSPLMKLGQFWPLLPPPGQTKCYLTAKSSLQHSIHIFRKSKKNQQLFLWAFFEEPRLYDRGGSSSPPPHPIGLTSNSFSFRILTSNSFRWGRQLAIIHTGGNQDECVTMASISLSKYESRPQKIWQNRSEKKQIQ